MQSSAPPECQKTEKRLQEPRLQPFSPCLRRTQRGIFLPTAHQTERPPAAPRRIIKSGKLSAFYPSVPCLCIQFTMLEHRMQEKSRNFCRCIDHFPCLSIVCPLFFLLLSVFYLHNLSIFLNLSIFPLTCRQKCANIYQLNKHATVAQSVEQLIRNQQVAGSSPASSSTGTRFSCENRVFCLQKRLENGVFPPLWPQSGLGQRLGQAPDPD